MIEAKSKENMLSLSITDKNDLYAAYMPFVINGGLFIPSNFSYEMGEDVSVSLTLMNENKPLAITGKVIWTTPCRLDSFRLNGIGIQFSKNDSSNARNKIETYLTGTLMSDRSTLTM